MPHRLIRKVVFPAAGLGTRFLPATKAQPKEMLSLVDKPIIQYGVEEAHASGLKMMVFVTGRGKTAIEDHFDVSFELERTLEDRGHADLLGNVRLISNMLQAAYVRQKEALGLGHAVLMAQQLVGNEPFAVLLADDIIDAEVPCLRQMMDVYERFGQSVVAVCEVSRDRISSYGVIAGTPVEFKGSLDRVFDVSDLVEKPLAERAPSNLAIIGRYILTPEVFEELSATQPGAGGEIQLTDGIRGLIARGQKVYGYRFAGRRHDAGDKLGFLVATVEFALKREGLGDKFRDYLKSLRL